MGSTLDGLGLASFSVFGLDWLAFSVRWVLVLLHRAMGLKADFGRFLC